MSGINYKRLALASAIIFGATSYGSYKYHEIQTFETLLQKNSSNKRDFMRDIHKKIAFGIDSKLEGYERANKIDQYRKLLVSFAEGKVLETGIGTARNNRYYVPGCQVTGVDWTPEMLEIALMKQTPTLDVDYKLEDVEKLSFSDNTFDTVVDTFGLDYYLDPRKALSEIKRVCKKDGRILLMASGYSHYDLLNLFLEYKAPSTICTYGYFPNRKWEEIILDKDFEIQMFERKLNGTVYFYILKNSKK